MMPGRSAATVSSIAMDVAAFKMLYSTESWDPERESRGVVEVSGGQLRKS